MYFITLDIKGMGGGVVEVMEGVMEGEGVMERGSDGEGE
jgi:hypothetical protein